MQTCKIGKDKYYLKFSDEDLFEDNIHPSLQILIEYFAYSIYALYASIKIPKYQLVFDKSKDVVGLATSEVKGKSALGRVPTKKLGKMMSQGVYVDIFLANWDVVGTGSGNVMIDDDDSVTRIDPGGSLTFRAQGGKKGSKFDANASELKSMLNPNFGAGEVFSYADLHEAAQTFLSVPREAIDKVMTEVYNDVNTQLLSRGMHKLAKQWQAEIKHIVPIMNKRWIEIAKHASLMSNKKVA
jgi:hypothetical protein